VGGPGPGVTVGTADTSTGRRDGSGAGTPSGNVVSGASEILSPVSAAGLRELGGEP
jgi:hypothetical protein